MDVIPQGTIWMYYQHNGNIPPGWHECDGTNGTPNLCDRYPIGTANFEEVGQEVGDAKHHHQVHVSGGTGTAVIGGYVPDQAFETRGNECHNHNHGVDFIVSSDEAQWIPQSVKLIFIMKL